MAVILLAATTNVLQKLPPPSRNVNKEYGGPDSPVHGTSVPLITGTELASFSTWKWDRNLSH